MQRLERDLRRERDGRRRVAPGRLQQDGTRGSINLAQLLSHHETVGFVADDDRAGGPGACQAACGGLQHRLLAHEGQQLLGVELAGKGPQAGSGAAGENHGNQHGNPCRFREFGAA